MIATLYICYFGIREPLVQTQVIPYLSELIKDGVDVTLLTFEPSKNDTTAEQKDQELLRIENELLSRNIDWHWLRYHKWPSAPATLFDILNAVRYVRNLSRKKRFDILHARAHVPLLIARIVKSFTGSKIVFDMRGLIADEYVDGGIWRANSTIYHLVKKLEAAGIQNSDGVVVLTEKLKQYIGKRRMRNGKVTEVIPCCVDFRFANLSEKIMKDERFELIYAGSIVGLYLLEEMGKFFLTLKKYKPNAFFRILTISPANRVSAIFHRLGIAPTDFVVQAVASCQVIPILERAHAAISFRTPTFSQIGASPTKIAEYMAAGIPIVMNSGIGDMDDVIERSVTGVIVRDFDKLNYEVAARALIDLADSDSISERCRRAAYEYFDLESIGGVRYRRLYRDVLGQVPPPLKTD